MKYRVRKLKIFLLEVSEGYNREKEADAIIEKIMTEKFIKLMRANNPQNQESQQTPSKVTRINQCLDT